MCVGHRFASTEAVCFLSMLLRDWRVEPKLNDGENVDEWKKRVLSAHLKITLNMNDAPLHFTRRKPMS